MYFYIVFAVMLFFFKKKIHIPVAMLSLFYCLYYLGNANFEIERGGWVYAPYIITDFHCIAFALGSLMFYVKVVSFKKTYIPVVLTIIIITFVVLSKRMYVSDVNMVIISSIILYLIRSADLTRGKVVSFLSFIGDASYTIYISHMLFLKVAWDFARSGDIISLLFLNIFAIAFGCASYLLISKKLLKLCKKIFTLNKTPSCMAK